MAIPRALVKKEREVIQKSREGNKKKTKNILTAGINSNRRFLDLFPFFIFQQIIISQWETQYTVQDKMKTWEDKQKKRGDQIEGDKKKQDEEGSGDWKGQEVVRQRLACCDSLLGIVFKQTSHQVKETRGRNISGIWHFLRRTKGKIEGKK